MKKTILTYGLGCATLPVLMVAIGLAAAAWTFLTLPVDASLGRNGSTPQTALLVEAETDIEAVTAEHLWLASRRPSDIILLQELQFDSDRVFDAFEMQTPEGERYTLYFDITQSYGKE